MLFINAFQLDVKMNRIKLALIALSNLMRIDYDLIAPSVPDILAKLFLVCLPSTLLVVFKSHSFHGYSDIRSS